ncbi:MgtC/SapB family protein [Achromobacter sp. Root565]|uniref:MgtC/SapB family protein n=1 Tax=Achromobacter sp. Root565 TaxID=1736564 RepID=UPI0006FA9068|nr:MgtC/SapB family protein [Achromobacter sp. Root565]KRA01272.1 methyltransferase [Achromobacter sp. Root565]
MQAFQNFDLHSMLDTSLSLVVAFVLGALIGLERQYRQRTAGLRTNVLVAVGAALFVDVANRLAGADGAVRVIAYVVSGVGFLGAGVIMREEGNVRGLNTAATLWGSAAVGAAAGADLLAEAMLGAVFVLAANTLLRPFVNAINRQPLDAEVVEVTYAFHLIVSKHAQKRARQSFSEELERMGLHGYTLEVRSFSAEEVEIEATLEDATPDAIERDALLDRLGSMPGVRQAFCAPSTRN